LKAEQTMKKSRKKLGGGTFFQRNLSGWLIMLPSVFLFFFLVWRPIGMGVVYSFFRLKNYVPVEFVGLQNYRDVLSDTLFLKTLWNTVQYVIWSIIIGFIPPILFAVIINEMVHINSFMKTSIYFPQIVPAVAAALVWYFLYLPGQSGVFNIILSKFGLPANNWLQNAKQTIPLIIFMDFWNGCGGAMLLYLAALQGINQELYEAAKIDGAGIPRRFMTVTFPSIFPIILLQFVRQIINVFQIMQQPMTLTGGGPNNASISLNLTAFKYAFERFQPERALALGVVTFLILIVVTCFYFRVQKKYGE